MVDELHGVQQVLHGDDADDRGALQGPDQHVPRGRDDGAHGLRQDDPPEPAPGTEAERLGGLQLAAFDGEDAAADHFGGVRGLVERESYDGDGDRAEQVDGADAQDLRVEGADVEPEEQLDQDRGGPEQPDVAPAHGLEHAVAGEPEDREQGAEGEAQHHDEAGEPEGEAEAPEHGVGREVGADDVPLEGVVAYDGDQGAREEEQDEDSGRPPAGPAYGDDARGALPGMCVRWGGK